MLLNLLSQISWQFQYSIVVKKNQNHPTDYIKITLQITSKSPDKSY